MTSFLLAEPAPGDISPCHTCPFKQNEEMVFSALRLFVVGLDLIGIPRDEQVGNSLTQVSLLQKGDIPAKTINGAFSAVRRLNGLPVPEGDIVSADENGMSHVFLHTVPSGLAGLEVPTERWDKFVHDGCPGPVEGGRKFIICGSKKVSCGVINFVQQNAG